METTAPLVQILIVIGNATKQALPKVSKEIIRGERQVCVCFVMRCIVSLLTCTKDEIVSMLDTFQLSPVVVHASIITLSQVRKNHNEPHCACIASY